MSCRGARCRSGRCSSPRRSPSSSPARCPTCTSTSCSTPAAIAGRLRAFGFGAIGSDATNNLPAILAGSASLHDTDQVWALLAGTNLAPILVITGSLSGLLWRDTAGALRRATSPPAHYSAVGLRVGLLAVLAGGLTVVLG